MTKEVILEMDDPELEIEFEPDFELPSLWQVKDRNGPWSFKTGSLVREEDEFLVLDMEERDEKGRSQVFRLRIPRGLCKLLNVAEGEDGSN